MQVSVSLNPAVTAVPPPDTVAAANVLFVQNFVAEVLHNAFPHLTQLQLKVTVEGLFNLDQDITGFREHLRDFLVQIKVSILNKLKNFDAFHLMFVLFIGIYWR